MMKKFDNNTPYYAKRITSVYLLCLAISIGLAGCEKTTEPTEVSSLSNERHILGEHEHAKDFGTHMVHVNTLATSQLSPEVARAYKIARSKNKILLNIFIAEKSTKGNDMPVTGDVKVLVKNLSNQIKPIDIVEVQEGDTIYYLGEVSVANQENLIFEIDIVPEGLATPYLLSYRQQFFTE